VEKHAYTMGKRLKGRDLIQLGFPQNNTINIALGQLNRYKKKEKKARILEEAKEVLLEPERFMGDAIWGKIAEGLIKPIELQMHKLNSTRAPFSIYGENEIDEQAKFQLYDALKLPIAKAGALMPDAHVGYGLPIGGVLATENAVIPYGVGLDIGCRMSLSVFPMKASYLKGKQGQFEHILKEHTKFGMYETHRKKMDHELFDRPEFREVPLLKKLKMKAYNQLGTSGGGNHFVEFGVVTISDYDERFALEPGEYVGLLSHSGSRGLGANIAKHYSYLATKQCPLPKHVQHLAWLDLDSHDGQEYWMAMNLAGDYATACHENIHTRIEKLLGCRAVSRIENHHNFAWKEMHKGSELIVHRKGATPAGKGVLGIIPGSMTSPGYIVRGLGNSESLYSASHGAGRKHSRRKCKETFTKSSVKQQVTQHGVSVIGGSVEEAPMAYKNIKKVMNNQRELVEVLGTFTPKIVRMDG
jgi:tRNA-splicing ligase RtcB